MQSPRHFQSDLQRSAAPLTSAAVHACHAGHNPNVMINGVKVYSRVLTDAEITASYVRSRIFTTLDWWYWGVFRVRGSHFEGFMCKMYKT